MDLSTIKQRIDTRAYQFFRDFVRDFALIPSNAQVFNRPDSSAYRDSLVIERELKNELHELVERGAIEERDSWLPEFGEMTSYDGRPDRSYRLDSSTSESLLAMDANMESLLEWQNKTSAPLPSSSNKSLPKVGQPPPKEPEPESVAKICYTCRHRFARADHAEEIECPKCGSDFVFTDVPWNTASNVPAADNVEKHGPGPALHPLGIAPSQLLDLIHDIGDTTARLQSLQDRYSKNTKYVPEAVDQLMCLTDGFKRLANLQEDSEYRLRFQRVQENVHVLCSSVRCTITMALNTLRTPLNETQWMELCSSMRGVEHTDIWERLRWYQAAIMGLLNHLNGFTSESLLGMDTNIRLLLERQIIITRLRSKEELSVPGDQNSEPHPEASTSKACYTCHTELPDFPESKAGICPTCGSWYMSNPGTPSEKFEAKEAEPSNPSTKGESTDLDQPHDLSSTSQQLIRLVASTTRALDILSVLQIHHSRDATIIPEITDDLTSLLTAFQRLSRLQSDPKYELNFVKVQESIHVLCRSMQHTLDALLQVLTAEPHSDETMLMQLMMLTAKMAGEERVGLPERLRWYSASVLGLLNDLDGFPSTVRIFHWLGMDEKVRSLLERQEGSRE